MVQIKKLNQNNLPELIKLVTVLNTVFENKLNPIADEKYLLQLLAKKEFVVFVALMGDEIVGGLTACELPLVYRNESELFIYDIGVHPYFQRLGIGLKLIESAKNYCISNNIKIVFVAADADDNNALNFYKKTGASLKEAVHFEYNL